MNHVLGHLVQNSVTVNASFVVNDCSIVTCMYISASLVRMSIPSLRIDIMARCVVLTKLPSAERKGLQFSVTLSTFLMSIDRAQ